MQLCGLPGLSRIYLYLLWLGSRAFGHLNRQHTMRIVGLNLLRVYHAWKREGAREGTKMPFHAAEVFLLDVLFEFAFPVHRQHVILNLNLDVFFFNSWCFYFECQFLVRAQSATPLTSTQLPPSNKSSDPDHHSQCVKSRVAETPSKIAVWHSFHFAEHREASKFLHSSLRPAPPGAWQY
jgi:hypothetical protein